MAIVLMRNLLSSVCSEPIFECSNESTPDFESLGEERATHSNKGPEDRACSGSVLRDAAHPTSDH